MSQLSYERMEPGGTPFFGKLLTAELILIYFMIFITFYIEYNTPTVWIYVFIGFIIVLIQSLTPYYIYKYIRFIHQIPYELFIRQSNKKKDDIYLRVYCYYHYILYHKGAQKFIGFGSDDMYYYKYDNQNEQTLLINSNTKYHPPFSGQCYKLLHDFTFHNHRIKKDILQKMIDKTKASKCNMYEPGFKWNCYKY